MTRTEKAIEDTNIRLKREYYPVALVEDFTAEVTLAYNRECKISRFKTLYFLSGYNIPFFSFRSMVKVLSGFNEMLEWSLRCGFMRIE